MEEMRREYDRQVDAYKLQLKKQEERILESETKVFAPRQEFIIINVHCFSKESLRTTSSA